MDKLKRFIDIYVPVESCTLRCHYCYITHHRLFNNKLPQFKYSPEEFRKALSKNRLGGVCMFNFCGGGETLLPPELPQYVRALLDEGHYVMIVTNGTVDRAFDEFETFPPEYLSRLFFKFSYHYLEFKQKNFLERFFRNVRRMRDVGASFTVEATPSDELIPYIDEMKQRCLEEVGAINHVTVARDEHDMSEIPILSKMKPEDYQKTWSVFDSEMFNYKFRVFLEKRTEFCYAGDWTLFLNMGTGELSQCYCSLFKQNIFEDVTKPLIFKPIGHHCLQPHCFNAHAWLTFGAIPEHDSPTYDVMRNRICTDKTEWVQPRMKSFMHQKLKDNNPQRSYFERLMCDWDMYRIKHSEVFKYPLYSLKHAIFELIHKNSK